MKWKRFIKCKDEMLKAIQEENLDKVKNLISEGFDVDSELMYHKYPISICVEIDCLEIGKMLIKHGCSLSLKTQHGNTPLHLAVQLLNFDFVKLLLDNRADLTSIDSGGKTVLHLAAEMNSLRMVKLLMEKANTGVLNLTDNQGRTPFIYACSHGSEALVSYFLTKGCDVNKDCDYYGNTPLLSAISYHNCSLEKCIKLLDAGANINCGNKYDETPLLTVFHALASNNFSGSTYALFQDICCLLIDRGCDVNVRNSLGNSPLHLAVTLKDERIVRKLLNAGSHVSVINDLGCNPFSYAYEKGMTRIATLLFNSGDISSDQWLIANNESILYYAIREFKEYLNLKDLCRLIIRRFLQKNIEKSSQCLPLPPSLIQFIQLKE